MLPAARPVLVARHLDASVLAAAVLAVHFSTVFFSVAAQNIAAALGWAVFAASIRWKDLRVGRDLVGSGPWPAMGLFLLASAASGVASGAPWTAWRAVRPELLAFGCFVVALRLRRFEHARTCVLVLVAAAAVAGAWSVYQVLVLFGGETNPGRRATGFWHLGASVSYGNVLAIVFALVVSLGVWARARGRVWSAVAAAMLVVGMTLSYIRASWLASCLVVSAVGVWRRSLVLLGALILAIGAVALLPAGKVVADRVLVTLDPSFEGNSDRLARYRVGAAVVRDHPVFGTGPGVLREVYGDYAVPGALVSSHLHNTYLQLLAERGPLALGAWVAFMVGGIVHVLRASERVDRAHRGLAIGIGLALLVTLLLALFNYIWGDWRIRSIVLALLGLAWSPAVTNQTETPAGSSITEVSVG